LVVTEKGQVPHGWRPLAWQSPGRWTRTRVYSRAALVGRPGLYGL
jgi:hypothetical protein